MCSPLSFSINADMPFTTPLYCFCRYSTCSGVRAVMGWLRVTSCLINRRTYAAMLILSRFAANLT